MICIGLDHASLTIGIPIMVGPTVAVRFGCLDTIPNIFNFLRNSGNWHKDTNGKRKITK